MFNFFRQTGIAVLALSALANTKASGLKTCKVPFGGPGVDDSLAVMELLLNCSTNAHIIFKEHKNYNISTPINFGTLTNVTISINGNLTLPASIPYVQSLVNVTGSLYWFTIKGNGVTLEGSKDADKGFIFPQGVPWWEAAPYTLPLGGLPLRPHLFRVAVTNNALIQNMKISKPIAWTFSLSGDNYIVKDNWIDASYDLDTPEIFPFNTDGYDVGGTNFTFSGNYVFNGDDCVAVGGNSYNVYVTDMVCEGGHGISISATNGVSNVTFNNITSMNSLYATRFKSDLNSTGNVSHVTWQNIKVVNATFPVFATSVYVDQNTNRGVVPGQYPPGTVATHISNFTWANISGTINDVYPGDGSCVTDPCWYFVNGTTNRAGVTFQLLNDTATGIHLENINLVPINGKGVSDTYCDPTSFADGTAGLGFVCDDGPYKVAKD